VRNQAIDSEALFEAAVEAFGPHFFMILVLVMDSWSVHRIRVGNLKDGNPLNETRL
jgi:hypothetical protein